MVKDERNIYKVKVLISIYSLAFIKIDITIQAKNILIIK